MRDSERRSARGRKAKRQYDRARRRAATLLVSRHRDEFDRILKRELAREKTR